MRKLVIISVMSLLTVGAYGAEVNVCSEPELNSAIIAAKPGDDIVMCNKEWPNLQLSFDAFGTASAPITLRAEQPGETVLTGQSEIRFGGSFVVIKGLRFQDGFPRTSAVEFANGGTSCRNCRLTEVTIVDYAPTLGSAEFEEYQFYVRLFGVSNRVDHNYFSGKHGKGQVIKVDVTQDRIESHRIDHNYFGHRIKHPSGNSGEALQIGSHNAEFFQGGVLVENNYFERSNGEFEIISVKSSGNTIRRNVFDRCEGTLELRHGDGNWVDANAFLGYRDDSKKVSGIRVSGENHVITNNYIHGIKVGSSGARGGINLASGKESYSVGGRRAAKNILIAFNTIVDSDRSISVDDNYPIPPSDIVIANNIISSGYGPLIAEDMPISNGLYSKNIAFGASIGVESSGFIEADPMLVRSNGIHRITGNSPAKDNADSEHTPLLNTTITGQFTDNEGQSRPSSLHDIGADEYFETGGPGLLSKCDTGPQTYNFGLLESCSGVKSGEVIPSPPTWSSP